MSTATLLAGLLMAQAALPVSPETASLDRVDVAFSELRQGRAQAAVQRIQANNDRGSEDPAALINLGTAYARLGRIAEARESFEQAMASRERYDLELANGQWMDSRRAARVARDQLLRRESLAMAARAGG